MVHSEQRPIICIANCEIKIGPIIFTSQPRRLIFGCFLLFYRADPDGHLILHTMQMEKKIDVERGFVPMENKVVQFPGLRRRREANLPPLSDQYYDALAALMASLRETASEYGLPIKEVTVDLLYLSVGDEIVTQMIGREEK